MDIRKKIPYQMVRHCNWLARKVKESEEVFKVHLDLVLDDVVQWFRHYSGSAERMVGLSDFKDLFQS